MNGLHAQSGTKEVENKKAAGKYAVHGLAHSVHIRQKCQQKYLCFLWWICQETIFKYRYFSL